MPKPGYSGAYAVFGTNYGSIDTKIRTESGEIADIPEGTAHFLEHRDRPVPRRPEFCHGRYSGHHRRRP